MDKLIGPKYEYDNVYIVPKRSVLRQNNLSPQELLASTELPSRNLEVRRQYKSLWHKDTFMEGVPIIAANMDHVGTSDIAFALGLHQTYTALHKFHTEAELYTSIYRADYKLDWLFFPGLHYTWISIGGKIQDIEFLHRVVEQNPNLNLKINIDVANGYLHQFLNLIKRVRNSFPDAAIMAGNVATPEVAADIILSGADFVKCGIGPGLVCTTRDITGVGYPQLSAVLECADAVHGVGGLLCADGGCRKPGDIAKALGAGADLVMLGGMFAGHDECGGTRTEVVDTLTGQPIKHMEFYGMSSKKANDKYFGGLKEYRAAEGKCIKVPYKGSIHDTINEILGGLRSTMTLVGCDKVENLKHCVQFVVRHK